MDKDRKTKFQRPDGEGEAKPSDAHGRASKGHGRESGAQPQQRAHNYGRWGGGDWGNQSWNGGGNDELKALRQMVQQLAKLVLRHEDSVNLWRAESSYVLFVRTGIPSSLVPSLFAAKAEWKPLKDEQPDKVRRPMRNVLFSCLVREMHDRLVKLKGDKARRASMEKLGWLKGDEFQRLRWDPQSRKHVHDAEGSAISYEDVLTILQALMTVQYGGGAASFSPHTAIGREHAGGYGGIFVAVLAAKRGRATDVCGLCPALSLRVYSCFRDRGQTGT